VPAIPVQPVISPNPFVTLVSISLPDSAVERGAHCPDTVDGRPAPPKERTLIRLPGAWVASGVTKADDRLDIFY
jgi:hypothetical protein